jgi:hypothetical protein
VDAAAVAIPPQGPPIFSAPLAPRRLSATFNRVGQIVVAIRVNGKPRQFYLDSGTTQLIMDSNAARGIASPILNHAVADFDVDDSRATDAPFIETPFFFEGLLGYDFFRGTIVHVDYARERVDILPRDGFVAPSGGTALPTDWSEGMPLVTATVGERSGDRFALDLGSNQLFLSADFLNRPGASISVSSAGGRRSAIHYLEGIVDVASATTAALTFGTTRIVDVPTQTEVPSAANLSIPLDGIIGTQQLSLFEWWFDADGPVTWYRHE